MRIKIALNDINFHFLVVASTIQLRETSQVEEDSDDPLYDSVAEDEDYAVPQCKDEEVLLY